MIDNFKINDTVFFRDFLGNPCDKRVGFIKITLTPKYPDLGIYDNFSQANTVLLLL